MQAPTLLTTWLLATAILVAVAAKYDEERAQASLQTIFYALTAFICSVYCSIGIYRVSELPRGLLGLRGHPAAVKDI